MTEQKLTLYDMADVCRDESKRIRAAIKMLKNEDAIDMMPFDEAGMTRRAEIFEYAERFILKCAGRQQSIFRVLRDR